MLKKISLTLATVLAVLVIGGAGYISVSIPGGLSGFWLMLSTVAGMNRSEAEVQASNFVLPDGFQAELVAEDLGYARFILVTENNDLLVSLTDVGHIVLLQDRDGNGNYESKSVLIEGLSNPQGLAFDGDWLYFSERDKVSRVTFDQSTSSLLGEIEIILKDLPFGHPHMSHNAKTIGISPGRQLYVTVGSPCNVCEPEDARYSAMLRSEMDGSNLSIYATGLRNSVGFDWAPWGDLYATVNARDMLGDDFPPDELNLIVEGGFYGWPYFNGDNIPDPDFGDKRPDLAAESILPAFKFRAHNAPLGIHFVEAHKNLPEEFQRTALVALHGSWNRSELDGYRVISLHWDAQGNIESRDFLSGFLAEDGILGRPVDVAQDNQGRFYVTDDLGGRVYRIQYLNQ
jgi:glucose/arabinose dehydrogenase